MGVFKLRLQRNMNSMSDYWKMLLMSVQTLNVPTWHVLFHLGNHLVGSNLYFSFNTINIEGSLITYEGVMLGLLCKESNSYSITEKSQILYADKICRTGSAIAYENVMLAKGNSDSTLKSHRDCRIWLERSSAFIHIV